MIILVSDINEIICLEQDNFIYYLTYQCRRVKALSNRHCSSASLEGKCTSSTDIEGFVRGYNPTTSIVSF